MSGEQAAALFFRAMLGVGAAAIVVVWLGTDGAVRWRLLWQWVRRHWGLV